MFFAELTCSDERCAERFEQIGTLEELETLACDCGCGLIVVSVAETDLEGPLELVPMGSSDETPAPARLRDAA